MGWGCIRADPRATRVVSRVASIVLLVAGLLVPAGEADAQDVRLDVPYLPQTEALCGGAAAAMLFRYWGERHADVQQFAPLVDRRAGGIADEDLIAAIRARHWRATRIDGSIERLRSELAAGRPPMLLLEDRPGRYHYVVVVSADDRDVFVHDPAWGPSRRLSLDALQRAWKPSGFWTLQVVPGGEPSTSPRARPSTETSIETGTIDASSDAVTSTLAGDGAPPGSSNGMTPCEAMLDEALTAIQKRPLAAAAARLEAVRAACPADPGPLRELAGVRFAERKFGEAAALAEDALRRDPHDPYAADVLGSSRFMLNDYVRALQAWNRIGRPQLDSVHIGGLTRTRYSLFALALGLDPNTLLTDEQFTLARRRLESMPDQTATRIAVRPDPDGFAIVDVAVVEQRSLPRTPIQWGAATAQSILEREVAVSIPGRTGQGEMWSGTYRWWRNRPRASIEFAAPRFASPRGVLRFRAAWESQSYGSDESNVVREERLQGQLGLEQWVTANVRTEISAGVEAWVRPNGRRDRTAHVSASIERRAWRDRLAATLSVGQWAGLGGAPGFSAANLGATFRSRREPRGLVVLARAGASIASREAPLALWSGAGEGRGRGPLLRAHRLLRAGRINGTMFGRQMAHATLEARGWLPKPSLVRIGGALFADTAVAGKRPDFAVGQPFQFDAGFGLRLRVPGRGGVFRLDLARGVRDGARAIIATWQAID
ncbi:MAG: C39 family peptidase [Vicinamibacterales bacterium]